MDNDWLKMDNAFYHYTFNWLDYEWNMKRFQTNFSSLEKLIWSKGYSLNVNNCAKMHPQILKSSSVMLYHSDSCENVHFKPFQNWILSIWHSRILNHKHETEITIVIRLKNYSEWASKQNFLSFFFRFGYLFLFCLSNSC